MSTGEVTLHQAFGANLIAAHSVDYLKAVRIAAGIPTGRLALVKKFDSKFAIAGAYLRNRKMQLIDAINNGFKHIRLDPGRYEEVLERYGDISFQSLDECNGRIMCRLDTYRFDYCRVVLMPALQALSSWEFGSPHGVLNFAKGDFEIMMDPILPGLYDAMDPSSAIDQMIDLCSPPCANCGESTNDCQCAEYVFDGNHGQYKPLYSASPELLDALMDQISPSYRNA